MSRTESILQQIIHRVQETQRLCLAHPSISKSSCSLAPQSSPRRPPDNISLPEPPSMKSTLLAAGARPDISLAMDQAYQKRAVELRAFCLSAVASCSNMAPYPSGFRSDTEQKLLSLFTELYLRQLVTWREECVVLYLKYSSDNIQGSSGATKFNHEYVPLLEYFFAENPFPTHADKAFLAKKSAMTYRQIHVWFQNRRNRMKKEGQVLRKKAVAEGATLPLDNLYQRMQRFIVQEERTADTLCPPESPTKQGNEMVSIADNGCNPLEPLAPLHAFPASYPPSCSYDPFPSKNGVTNFGAPTWLRYPMTTRVRRPTLDIDELIDCFSRINVLDDSGLRSRSSNVNSFAAVAAITVIPFPAPLPALIRGTVTHIAPIRVPLLAVPATTSRRHVFDTPSPMSRPITLVPASETPRGQKARRRKIAPLPKRISHGNPVSHRRVTPAISEASVAPPSSPTSRSSSFGSESPSQGHLFSSGNSTTSSSSGIMTPPPSFPSPSTQLASPASLFSFSSNMTDLFGDALENIPSPAEALHLDFNSSIVGSEHILKSPALDSSFGATPPANPVHAPS